jgi:glutamyl/glutaminyl-tRNA synthetase
MILGEDKSRMSKRHGATAISEYRRQGYLPEALVNYLALLGWSPGNDREIFTLQTLVKDFSLKRVNKTAAVFDITKLNWINGQYIKNLDNEKLIDLLVPGLTEKGFIADTFDRQWLSGLIGLYKTRFSTLEQFAQMAGFFFSDTVHYDEEAVKNFLGTEQSALYLEKLKTALEAVGSFTPKDIENATRVVIEDLKVSAGELIHPVRVALTGGTVSPGIFEVIAFLGKDKTTARLDKVAKKIRSRSQMFDKLSGL